VRRLFIQEDLRRRPRLEALQAAARTAGVEVRLVPAAWLAARAATDRHQGAAAEVEGFRYRAVDELLEGDRGEPPLLLALDGIEDPHNLGAIVRSADGAGVHGIILPAHRSATVTPAVARVSAGAVEHVPIAQVVNLPRTLEALKSRGLWVYGLDVTGDTVFDAADYDRPVVIVAGAEGKGLSRLVRERCDVRVIIPLAGQVESLNVSVATSLALFAARRARQLARSGARI
jgi:23S rRNA (guanosine2251-2'-O)-methyltransferase